MAEQVQRYVVGQVTVYVHWPAHGAVPVGIDSGTLTATWNPPASGTWHNSKWKVYCQACGEYVYEDPSNPPSRSITIPVTSLYDQHHPGPYDVTCSIWGYQTVTFVIEVASGNGTVTGSTSVEGTVDTQVQSHITATPDSGWEFSYWVDENGNRKESQSDRWLTVYVPEEPLTVYRRAVFEKEKVQVNVASTDEALGQITSSTSILARPGDVLTLSCTYDSSVVKFAGWSCNGSIDRTTTYTVPDVDSAINIYARFGIEVEISCQVQNDTTIMGTPNGTYVGVFGLVTAGANGIVFENSNVINRKRKVFGTVDDATYLIQFSGPANWPKTSDGRYNVYVELHDRDGNVISRGWQSWVPGNYSLHTYVSGRYVRGIYLLLDISISPRLLYGGSGSLLYSGSTGRLVYAG